MYGEMLEEEACLVKFELDDRLTRDSERLTLLGLCDVRLMRDSRWPWLVLVPQRPDVSEVFELTPLDQAVLTFEQNLVASALKKATGAVKINVGALGNIVRQLHVHVIARFEGDANWPGPVWGHGAAVPYEAQPCGEFKRKFLEALQS